MTSSCFGKQEPGCANRHGTKAFIRNMWRQKKIIFEGKMEGINKSTKKNLYTMAIGVSGLYGIKGEVYFAISPISRDPGYAIRHGMNLFFAHF